MNFWQLARMLVKPFSYSSCQEMWEIKTWERIWRHFQAKLVFMFTSKVLSVILRGRKKLLCHDIKGHDSVCTVFPSEPEPASLPQSQKSWR
jgi:hypothetical protein